MAKFLGMEKLFEGRHFDREIIVSCVRWYLRFKLSFRDPVEMMAERGLSMAHTTIMRWVCHYASEFERRSNRFARAAGASWRVDETYVKIRGEWVYLYRAVDREGDTVDFRLSPRRDVAAAKAFFRKAIKGQGASPRTVMLDGYAASHRAVREIKTDGELPPDTKLRSSIDYDGTLSTELAMIDDKQAYYHDMVTMGLPNRNDGTPMPAQLGAGGGYIPKGAKNVGVAKDFMKFWMRPTVMNENLKAGLGRWVPAIPQIVKDDPSWLDPSDPRAPYVKEAELGPTIASYVGFNPAMGEVYAEQLWGQAHADVIKNGMTPSVAIDKALKRAEQIFAKFVFD